MLTSDIAICIRAIDYSETSQIVTLFTRANGKIRAIAKGSKRAKSTFDGAIEVFSYGKIVFAESKKEKLATLTEFEQQPAFTPTGDNLFALNCCLLGTELLSNLTNDYDPHPELFDSFQQFLKNINEGQQRDEERGTRDEGRCILSFLILFQLSLLKEVGLQPILNYCVNCKTKFETRGTRTDLYFSSSANGLVCRDCEASFPDKIRLSRNAAKCLTNLKTLAESKAETLNEVEKVLVRHFTEILGRPPKMARHISGNLKGQ
jgi:DNA repair protein RecO (recombination protein O)